MKYQIIWFVYGLLVAHLFNYTLGDAARSIKDYLEIREDRLTAQTASHFQELYRALAYLGEELDFTQEPAQLMKEILRVSEREWFNEFEPYWRIFEELDERPIGVIDGECPDWFITDLKYIVSHLDNIVFVPFKGLLEHYVPPKLLQCSNKAVTSLYDSEAFTRTNIPLMVAFRGASGLKDDKKLLEYLQLIELPSSASKSQINLKNMAKAIRKLVPSMRSNTKQVSNFLDTKCEKLRSDRSFLLNLDVLILVNAFEDQFCLTTTTRIFLEFNRICSAWVKPDIREATLKAFKK